MCVCALGTHQPTTVRRRKKSVREGPEETGRDPGLRQRMQARPPGTVPRTRCRHFAKQFYFRRISRLMAAMTSEVEACELCEEVVGRERHRCQQCGLLCAVCAGAHSKMKVLLKCRRPQSRSLRGFTTTTDAPHACPW